MDIEELSANLKYWRFIYNFQTSNIVQKHYSYAYKNNALNLCVVCHDWYIRSGTAIAENGVLIATLPEGYHPVVDSIYEYSLSGYIVVIRVSLNGQILIASPTPITTEFTIAIRMQSVHAMA